MFLDGSAASTPAHADALAPAAAAGPAPRADAHALAAAAVGAEAGSADGPLLAVTPADLERLLDIDVAPEQGAGLDATLDLVRRRIVRNSVHVAHPLCAAHLHCPPLLASLAAEAVISATNQSLDSWDQAPAATHVEERMIAWL